jgi:sirohydrochlorin ferrochelatase
MPTGYTVFAHGSSVESANEAVRMVVEKLRSKTENLGALNTSFLEGGSPSLAEAVQELAFTGCDKIVVIPYFLTLGLHLKRDLPNLVAEAKAKFPHLEIQVADPLDGHPALLTILADRMQSIAGVNTE